MPAKKKVRRAKSHGPAAAIDWHTSDDHERRLRRDRGAEEVSAIAKIGDAAECALDVAARALDSAMA